MIKPEKIQKFRKIYEISPGGESQTEPIRAVFQKFRGQGSFYLTPLLISVLNQPRTKNFRNLIEYFFDIPHPWIRHELSGRELIIQIHHG